MFKPRPRALIAVLVLAGLAAGCGGRTAPPPADLILTNAVVATMAARPARAEALAAAGGKIVYVGSGREALRRRGQATRVIDLGGRLVLPSFQDSHVHLVTGGVELGLCDLNGLGTRDEVLARVREYAGAHPDAAWITGGGWDLPLFPQANPRKEDLDALVPDRPVILDSADGHSAWVNSRALALAGITADTPDPAGGRIERDPGTGVPSGTLRESAAGLVERLVPPLRPEDYIKGLRAGMALANRFGITSIVEASAGPELLDAYAALDRGGELTVRVLASLYVDTDKGVSEIPRLEDLRRRYAGTRLKATAAKIFADGVMEPHTAALLEPYADRPGDRGEPLLEPEAFDALARALDRAGFQIHVHAIGDRAVRMSLDAFEAAGRANGFRDMRHHIAHLELVDPADIPRFRRLGAAANFQALWAYPDTYITDLTLPILGPARSRWLYPIGSVVRTGAAVVGGSDWSVSSMNPLQAMQVAVTRRAPDAPPGEAWIPEEKVDLPAMLRAYTASGAWLCREEKIRGTLETGRAADFIVLDRDLFAIPAPEIGRTRVLLTFLEGREVFRDPSFPN
ncbi:MAG TPA: amidohydrolase [Candidatus Aminicenantes bacterium]|nr:amidohydrolase [Candidatus Aminicenantes bacterium]HRY64720.1 amidohydrolase [Candidatus Aminicenantes bacterium]HRZ71633.1 amidohydrolase [Candidatus Aminicenantes bacterium]